MCMTCEGERPVGRPMCMWEDIKIHLRSVCEAVDWIQLAQDRVQ
jgi:hypothetical protein